VATTADGATSATGRSLHRLAFARHKRKRNDRS